MTTRPVHGLVCAMLATIVVACSTTPAPTPAPTPASSVPVSPPAGSVGPSASASPSAPVVELLLKVTSEGGFINPVASLNALPLVEVYSDGRILTPAAADSIAPAPLLPAVDVRDVGPAGAAAIRQAIQGAGLDRPAVGGPGIPGDSGSDTFAVTIDGQTTETRLSGNGPGLGGPGVGGPGGPGVGPEASADGSADPAAAERAAAFDLLARLSDPGQPWGGSAAPSTRYVPSGFRVFAAPGAPATDPATARPPVDWPLATPLDQFGSTAQPDRGIAGLRQGAVIGADAAALAPVVAAATDSTAFRSGGAPWTLYVRPLLPDELGG
jgi:hypothetical protein